MDPKEKFYRYFQHAVTGKFALVLQLLHPGLLTVMQPYKSKSTIWGLSPPSQANARMPLIMF
jgi:hypothetical protein